MSNTYSFGPLRSTYFTTFEKLWIEGHVKEHNLPTDNVLSLLGRLSQHGTDPIKKKSAELLGEAHRFAEYAKDSFMQSWNRALGYSMKSVKPTGQLHESDVAGAKAATMWWLKEAPVEICKKVQHDCFINILTECVGNDGDLLGNLKKFTFKDTKTIECIRPKAVLETMDKTKGKKFPSYEGMAQLTQYEPAINLVPEALNLLNAIAWTADNVKKLELFKK